MSQDYQNPYELLQNKSKNEDVSQFQLKNKNLLSPATKFFEDSPDLINKNKKDEIVLAPLQNVSDQDFEQIWQSKYENLKLFQKIKRILTPFSIYYTQKWVTNN